jgi:hypothetical protein
VGPFEISTASKVSRVDFDTPGERAEVFAAIAATFCPHPLAADYRRRLLPGRR